MTAKIEQSNPGRTWLHWGGQGCAATGLQPAITTVEHHLLNDLNSAQREAVCHVEGPLLILAGPGSGKTRVVTHRIAWLLDRGIPAGQILALTFTNKAADEMRIRVERLVPGQRVWVSTYHRFAARMLRKYAPQVGLEENYTIYDTDAAGRALRRAVRLARIDVAPFTPDQIASAISWAKNRLITAEHYQPRPGHPLGALVRRIYPAYQTLLTKSNAADFDDLLLYIAVLLRDNPEIRRGLDERYRFVLVDEYQDTNLAQYAIARALSIDHANLAVTGDPDQSIYGWRGANLRNILDFEKDYPNVRVVRLEQNYRSTKRILRVASDLIAHNVKRKQKALFTDNEEGLPVRLVTYQDGKDEAESIAARIAEEIAAGRRRASDFVVFYRVNALSLPFERALRAAGVPYQLVHGVEFFQRKEIRDVLAFLQLLNNPRDDITLLRVINTPARGIGRTTVERLGEYAAGRGLSLLEAARCCATIETLKKRSSGLVRKFVAIFDRLAAVAESPLEEILGTVMTETGYKAQFEGSDREEDQQREANIDELLSVAREFDERYEGSRPLEAFLEETSLVGDTDDWESESDRATLMTLHASKGLEFPVVFLVAVEEGLLPHERSRERDDQLEEERRLLFVGITRAMEELRISRAQRRDFRGQRKMTIPSQFLMELPRSELDLEEPWMSTVVGSIPAPAPAAPGPAARPGGVRSGQPARLMTAAELAGSEPSEPTDPDEFRQGMLVRHPEYGLGKITALGGSGGGRTATVDFASAAGRMRLLLAGSPLRPVKQQ